MPHPMTHMTHVTQATESEGYTYMAYTYVTAKIWPEARQALEDVKLPKEVLSETIIRITKEYAVHGASDRSQKESEIQEMKAQIMSLHKRMEEIADQNSTSTKIKKKQTVANDHSKQHRTKESCNISLEVREVLRKIWAIGVEREGSQKKFIETMGITNDKVINNFVKEGYVGALPYYARTKPYFEDIAKFVAYAQTKCFDVVTHEELQVLQQYLRSIKP